MATAAQPTYTPALTPDEYLAMERRAAYKNEYVNGRIYAVTGASRAHNVIAWNIAAGLHARFRGRPCEAYQGDVRAKVSPTGLSTYPDVVALCGRPEFEDAAVDTLLNPAVIVAVLSESTERYDRTDKFAHDRRRPWLQEYVLVAQDRAWVEHYARIGEQWALTVFDGLDATLALPALDCAIPLVDVYECVAPFDAPPPRAPAR